MRIKTDLVNPSPMLKTKEQKPKFVMDDFATNKLRKASPAYLKQQMTQVDPVVKIGEFSLKKSIAPWWNEDLITKLPAVSPPDPNKNLRPQIMHALKLAAKTSNHLNVNWRDDIAS